MTTHDVDSAANADTTPRRAQPYRAYIFQTYVVLAAIAFGVLLFAARTTPYFDFDLMISHAVQSARGEALDALMRFVSGLGFNPLSILLTGLLVAYLYVIGLRWEAVMAVFASGGVTLVGVVIKDLVHRARPSPDLVNVLSPLADYSFPSGHVLHYTAFLGFLCFLLFTLAPRSWIRALGMFVCILLISLVGVSRIYLGQHWFSDVVGAYLLGSLWLALTLYLYRRGKPRVQRFGR